MPVKNDNIGTIDTLLTAARGRLIKNIKNRSTGTVIIKMPFRNGGVRGLTITEELEIGMTTIEELEIKIDGEYQ